MNGKRRLDVLVTDSGGEEIKGHKTKINRAEGVGVSGGEVINGNEEGSFSREEMLRELGERERRER